ncbi:sigma-54-dependent Fis family transcriptional regulator [Sphingomonas piscis]|uniref:DNA-binding transcriptional regulator NtrC n=1 Tax=Sphingomonas piscis TaxID=2714943 RepID=A0A6G7YS92_9SPHN|nr:sigma-54 dependent transcriptional regulator [Sphingomonas piscis]QIK79610.1 sigma-54-dependent Fis family transcriptional regulator [Sphingomonas piscis]
MAEQKIRSLLLVDSDADERRLVAAIATRAGWSVVNAADADVAVTLLQGPYGRDIQAVLIGNWQPETGPGLIDTLRDKRPNLPTIILSSGDSVSIAVEAMRAGASDFLTRPVAPERLLEALAANADRRRGAGELAPMAEKIAPSLSLEQLIGSGPEFRAALAQAAKAARSRLPILIVGEAGTGKETFARAIHAASLRSRGPLVVVDCKAIPANIIDSELFGHEKGAFPGAFDSKVGKLVRADGGTLLLDDITAMPPETQQRLDRVLATGEVRPVGCNGSYSIDVRVIATAGRRLPEQFDEGLAERITATTVVIPPLRERSEDIPSLSRHLLSRFSEQLGLQPVLIGNDALALLMRYGWPGNVRQLAGVLFRAALQCEGTSLAAQHFPHIEMQSRFNNRATDIAPSLSENRSEAALTGNPAVTLFQSDGHIRQMEDIEADIIRLAIGHYRGRMTEVARRLGIGRSTLYRKLGEIGIDTAA